jgi:hypothetical protein
MHSTTETRRLPAATTGDVDPNGDLVDELLDQLRDPVRARLLRACSGWATVDVDEHVDRVLAVVARVRGIGR